MLNFEDLNILLDFLVRYFTGSHLILGLLICIIFIMVLLARDLDFRYALTFTLPLLGFFVVIGWFGSVTDNQWIVNVGLIAVSVIYATAIVKLST